MGVLLGCLGEAVLFMTLKVSLSTLTGILELLLLSFLCGGIYFFLTEALHEIARFAPEKITASFLPIIKFIFFINYPLLVINTAITALIRRFVPNLKNSPGMTEDELRIVLLEGEKSGVPVGTFMTHRSNIRWLDLDAAPDLIRETVEKAGTQRYFPVASGDLDEVSGIVSMEDILLA